MRAFDTEEKDKAKSLLIQILNHTDINNELEHNGIKGYNDLPTTIS